VTGFTLHTATVVCSPPKITASWRHLLWGRSKVKVGAVDTSRMAGGNSPEAISPFHQMLVLSTQVASMSMVSVRVRVSLRQLKSNWDVLVPACLQFTKTSGEHPLPAWSMI
jgi:hypothetical protein